MKGMWLTYHLISKKYFCSVFRDMKSSRISHSQIASRFKWIGRVARKIAVALITLSGIIKVVKVRQTDHQMEAAGVLQETNQFSQDIRGIQVGHGQGQWGTHSKDLRETHRKASLELIEWAVSRWTIKTILLNSMEFLLSNARLWASASKIFLRW